MSISTDEERYAHVGAMIGALVAMERKRRDDESFPAGLWLLTVRMLATVLLMVAFDGHNEWRDELGDVGLSPSAADCDVVAEVRRVVLGQDVPVPGISVEEVMDRLGRALSKWGPPW